MADETRCHTGAGSGPTERVNPSGDDRGGSGAPILPGRGEARPQNGVEHRSQHNEEGRPCSGMALWFGADQWDFIPWRRLPWLVEAAHLALDLESLGAQRSADWKVRQECFTRGA